MDWIAQLKWSILRLDGFITEHANALMKTGKNTGIEFEVTRSPTFAFNLHDEVIGQGKDVLTALSHDTRHKIRRSMRAFENKLGPRSIEWAETAVQANDILEELTELHTSRWRWKGGNRRAMHRPFAAVSQRACRYAVPLQSHYVPCQIRGYNDRLSA